MSLNGAVLSVGATLSSSDTIDFVRVFGNVGTVSTPTDGSVTANKIGTGAVTSAKIADGTIVNADINASAGIAGSKLGTGAILQVVATTVTSASITSASAFNSFAEIQSAYRCTITPKSANNFLLLDCQFCFNQHGGTQGFIQHFKYYDVTNSADVFVGDALGSRNRSTMVSRDSHLDNNDPDSIHMRAYIPAVSTNARTYTPYMHCEGTGGEFDFGRSDSDGSGFQWTTPYLFTITEIGG
jgi:hypothetical protein